MIKGYTDIKQSQILANILPIESADMSYSIIHNIGQEPYHCNVPTFTYVANGDIPCWSVAALLDLLPPYLYEFDRGIDLNIYRNLNGKGWHCSYMPNCIENMKKDKFKLITNGDNLVNACYEMIVELKERNLI